MTGQRSKAENIELTIIMVNYDAKAVTEDAVRSIEAVKPAVRYEMVLVENGGKAEEYCSGLPDWVYVVRAKNRGFGNACNLGAEYARGETLLFLNNDTLMHEGTLEAVVGYLREHPGTGALGVRQITGEGRFDHGCKRGFPTPFASLCYFTGLDRLFPNNRVIGGYRQTFVAEDAVTKVDTVSGAFMAIPRKVFRKTGGFDEEFFMYGEDIDLCYRIKELGYEVVYDGEVSVTHLRGKSGLGQKSKTVLYHFYHSMTLYYRKHYQKRYPKVVSAAVLGGIQLKYRLALLKAGK